MLGPCSHSRDRLQFLSWMCIFQGAKNRCMLAVQHNAQLCGPKHGAALAMDGGMADTACYYTTCYYTRGKGIREDHRDQDAPFKDALKATGRG
jgi:hypothetical protein